MAATLSTLRSQIRLLLASTSDWPSATIDAWIGDAVRFYSAQFPRAWRYSQSLTTSTQSYDLPGAHGFQGVLSVEYPTGQDPQQFLTRVEERSNAFQQQDYVYALRGVDDSTAAASDTASGQIVFAQDVTTGETAIIEYLGSHTIPSADTDEITVPAHHWEAIIAFVDFRAHAELEADQAVSVSTISIVLAQLGQEARMKWTAYKQVMGRLEDLKAGKQSAMLDWSGMGL